MSVALPQVSLGLRSDTIGAFRPKGSSFPPVPSLLGHRVPKGLAASHKALSAEGRTEKSVPWQLPLERT